MLYSLGQEVVNLGAWPVGAAVQPQPAAGDGRFYAAILHNQAGLRSHSSGLQATIWGNIFLLEHYGKIALTSPSEGKSITAGKVAL